MNNASGFGFVDAENVTLTDTMDPGMELAGAPTAVVTSGSASALSCNGAAGASTFTCNFGTVSSGGVIKVTVPARVTAVSALPQSFVNTASVDTTSADDNTANDTARATASVAATASLSGTVFRDLDNNGVQEPGDVGVGGVEITLLNTATSVSLKTSTASDGTYSFSLLPPGTYEVLRGPVGGNVNNGRAIPGSAGGTANGSTLIASVTLSSDAATGYNFTVVPQSFSLGIEKVVDKTGPVVIGETLAYTITATNTGNTTQTNVVVTDSLVTPNSKTCASVIAGGTCVLTGSYVVQASDADFGKVDNTAQAVSTEVTTPVTDSTSTPVTQTRSLGIEKIVDKTGPVNVGDTLNYTITATNTGNTTQTNVVVTDSLVTPNSKTCASVIAGGTCVLTGSYVVQASDADLGKVDNTAQAVSTEVTTPVTDST